MTSISSKVMRRVAAALVAIASLRGGVMFIDSTFNLSDYSIVTWKSQPDVGITVGQTQTGGNHGQTLQILYTFPAGSGNAMVGLPRASFMQALGNGLRASDFGLFDFTTGNFNTAVNPSSSSGVMQFGVAVRYSFQFDQFARADVRVDNLVINVQSAAQPGPTITAINLPISNASGLSPGSPISITGTNLGIGAGDAATITIGGRAAPVIDFTSSMSLVAQVPVDMPLGSTTVTATYKALSSAPFSVNVDAFSPAISAPIFDSADAAITPSHAAVANTLVYLVAYGLGPTNPPMVTGVKAVTQAPTTTPVLVMFGGKLVQPDYAGRLVGTVGSYKVLFRLPPDVPVGDQAVFITVGGKQSNSISVTVGPPNVLITAIANAATFRSKGAAPNSFVSIFGKNFGTQDSAVNIFPAITFNGLSVLFNGTEAPLYFVSGAQGQINLVLPSELPETGVVSVQVRTSQGTSPPFLLQMASTDLGMFRIPDPSKPTRNNGAVLISNTQWRVMPTAMATAYGFPTCNGANAATVCAQPATVGNAIQIYLTGAGKATPNGDAGGMPLATGKLAPLTGIPLYLTVQTPAATSGGVPTRVDFSGITPGNAGLYQINMVIPDGVAPGDEVPVVITMPNGDMDTVTIAVRS